MFGLGFVTIACRIGNKKGEIAVEICWQVLFEFRSQRPRNQFKNSEEAFTKSTRLRSKKFVDSCLFWGASSSLIALAGESNSIRGERA